jgi:hypothetical protein
MISAVDMYCYVKDYRKLSLNGDNINQQEDLDREVTYFTPYLHKKA